MIHVLCVCKHLVWKREITVGVFQHFPGSPGEKVRFRDSQLVLLGIKQTKPRPLSVSESEVGGVGEVVRRLGGGGLVPAPHPPGWSSDVPVVGKVHLFFEASPHLGEVEGLRAAQRDGGRRLAGRAGLRKQESRGGATGERGKSCNKEMLGRLVSALDSIYYNVLTRGKKATTV